MRANSIRGQLMRVSDHAGGAELDLEAPVAVGFEAFAAPVTGDRGDVAVGPADGCAVGKVAFLHDVFATAARDEFGAKSVVWIEPVDAPSLDGGIVNAQGGAEPVGEFRRVGRAV